MRATRFNEKWLIETSAKDIRATFKSDKRKLELALARRAELLKK
jgi:hypothetical protein